GESGELQGAEVLRNRPGLAAQANGEDPQANAVGMNCSPWIFLLAMYNFCFISRFTALTHPRRFYDIHYLRTLHRHEGYGLRGYMSGGLYPSEKGRGRVRGRHDALYSSRRMH